MMAKKTFVDLLCHLQLNCYYFFLSFFLIPWFLFVFVALMSLLLVVMALLFFCFPHLFVFCCCWCCFFSCYCGSFAFVFVFVVLFWFILFIFQYIPQKRDWKEIVRNSILFPMVDAPLRKQLPVSNDNWNFMENQRNKTN